MEASSITVGATPIDLPNAIWVKFFASQISNGNMTEQGVKEFISTIEGSNDKNAQLVAKSFKSRVGTQISKSNIEKMSKDIVQVLASLYKPTENLKTAKDIKPVFLDLLTSAKVINTIDDNSGMQTSGKAGKPQAPNEELKQVELQSEKGSQNSNVFGLKGSIKGSEEIKQQRPRGMSDMGKSTLPKLEMQPSFDPTELAKLEQKFEMQSSSSDATQQNKSINQLLKAKQAPKEFRQTMTWLYSQLKDPRDKVEFIKSIQNQSLDKLQAKFGKFVKAYQAEIRQQQEDIALLQSLKRQFYEKQLVKKGNKK